MTSAPKPDFALPTMGDVARARGTAKLKVVSTFSGCGGSCLGFEMAGFEVVWASEFIEEAQRTYRANHPHTVLDTRDIREVKPEEILAATGLKVGELDVFNGSPPCSSFSMSGRREKGWGEVKKYSDKAQRTDDLFYEYVRLVRGLRPKVFVAENVAGLVRGTALGYFKRIMRELADSGYDVSCRILDAQWLGVPQSRQRTIFVGVRKDLELKPVHPSPFTYNYSIRDALPWITRVVHDTSGDRSAGDVTDRPSPAITVSGGAAHHHFKVEGPDEPAVHFGGFRATHGDRYKSRASLDEPSPAVMAHGMAGVAHHQVHIVAPGAPASVSDGERDDEPVSSYGKRRFTIRELKRICAFPEDFVLTGKYVQQWERLGRAVPPRMMFYVARTVRDEILLPLGLGSRDFVEAP